MVSPEALPRNARRTEPISTEDLKPLAPELGFEAAREATGKIYETLEKLKVWDGSGWDDGGLDHRDHKSSHSPNNPNTPSETINT